MGLDRDYNRYYVHKPIYARTHGGLCRLSRNAAAKAAFYAHIASFSHY